MTGCADPHRTAVDEFLERYDAAESWRSVVTYTKYRGEFNVCQNNTTTNCKPADFSDFDAIPMYSNMHTETIAKKPDKILVRTGEGSRPSISLCAGSKRYQYDYMAGPGLRDVVRETTNVSNCWLSSATGDFLSGIMYREHRDLYVIMNRTVIDGHDVLEIYKRDDGKVQPSLFGFCCALDESDYTLDEFWVYFDATTYIPIRSIAKSKIIANKIRGANETKTIYLQKTIYDFGNFEVNNVSDEEFVLPSYAADAERCSFSTQEIQRASEIYTAEENKVHNRLQTEDEFNHLTELFVNLPQNKCLGFQPRSYSEYLTQEGRDFVSTS